MGIFTSKDDPDKNWSPRGVNGNIRNPRGSARHQAVNETPHQNAVRLSDYEPKHAAKE